MEKKIDTDYFVFSDHFIRMGDILVDLHSISGICHDCNPRRFCNVSTACCSFYEITLTKQDITRIDNIMDMISKYLPFLRLDKGYENVFGIIHKNLFCIDKKEDGLCIFSYFDLGGSIRCAIHSAAIKLDLKPADFKPQVCRLWPLSLAPLRGKLRILTIDKYALNFNCVQKKQKNPYLHCSIKKILVDVFGINFRYQVEKSMNLLNSPKSPNSG